MTELKVALQEIKHLLLLNSKTVLTPDEVSLMYGLSKDYLYHLTSERVIPFHKPNGKKIFFHKDEIENWLLQNRQDTIDETQQKATLYTLKNNKGMKMRNINKILPLHVDRQGPFYPLNINMIDHLTI